MTKDFSKEVLQTIKEENIKPKAGWIFAMKNYTIWFIGGVSLLIGSISLAVVIHMIKNSGWEIYNQADESFVRFLFVSIPYFWVIFLGIFVLAAYYNVRHTKGGYRHTFASLAIVAVIVSSGLGILFYNVGLGQAIDNIATEKIPTYNKIMGYREKAWQRADKGFLGGTVVNKTSQGVEIKDMEGKIWKITASATPDMEVGKKIKILGDRINKENFKAKQVILEKKPFLLRKIKEKIANKVEAKEKNERKILQMRNTK